MFQWQQMFDAFIGFQTGNFVKQIVNLDVRYQAIHLDYAENTVKCGIGVYTTCCVTAYPVFPADDEGGDGSFSSIFVDTQVAILNVANKFSYCLKA
jgi:hypothetical protein